MTAINQKKILLSVGLAGIIFIGIGFFRSQHQGAFTGFVSDKTKTKGSWNAPIEIVEFSDFQCPACKHAQPVIEKLFKDYPGNIKMTYRHFPLAGHRWSPLAHQCAECAARQNKFWEYHDRMYAEQERWSVLTDPTETFMQYAKDFNLDLDQFGTCVGDEKVTARITKEKEEGVNRQVRSTPTFFINHERFVGSKELETNGTKFIRKKLGLES